MPFAVFYKQAGGALDVTIVEGEANLSMIRSYMDYGDITVAIPVTLNDEYVWVVDNHEDA